MRIPQPQAEKDQSQSSESKAQAGGASSVQLKGKSLGEQQAALSPGGQDFASQQQALAPTQLKGGGGSTEGAHAAAAHGTAGGGGTMPYHSQIQAAFGRHDVSHVQAYTGGAAAEANQALGSEAFATGSKVAFGRSPSLHTAAHEAAHVVQQRAGVSLKGGVGQSGDRYEQHADKVADAVVGGRSAEPILDTMTGGGGSGGVQAKGDIQFIGHDPTKALPAGAETPAVGSVRPGEHHLTGGERGAADQRRYTPDQYVEMWEAHTGRAMTAAERKILEKGCIGITWVNVGGVPPLDNAYDTFEQAEADMAKKQAIIAQHPDAPDGQGGKMRDYKVCLFAKMFFSNQQPHDRNKVPADPNKSGEENHEANLRANRAEQWQPDPDAFPVDPTTGQVDMTQGWLNPATGKREPYRYQSYRPRFTRDRATGQWEDKKLDENDRPDPNGRFKTHINFDYAFWDETTQSFWHANHAEPGMHVYQSTRDKFEDGYIDFDRVIYCVTLTKVLDPAKAASIK